MKAIIKVDVPEFQVGQSVDVYFRDTMCIKGVCEKEEEHRWIPVTEKLPDKEAEYMVTKEHLWSKEREVTTEWWIPHSNNWACFKFGWAIIAWAEKPTPYEGSEEDEDSD